MAVGRLGKVGGYRPLLVGRWWQVGGEGGSMARPQPRTTAPVRCYNGPVVPLGGMLCAQAKGNERA